MLSNYLNEADFYANAGFTSSDVNSDYVTFLIGKVNDLIQLKLSRIFQFNPGFSQKYYPENSKSVVLIGNWQPAGILSSITIVGGGSGYTSAPAVTISGSGGATARAHIINGIVTSIDIVYQGRPGAYTVAPTITIAPATGTTPTTATATATISTLEIQRGNDDAPTDDLTNITEGDDYRFLYYQDQQGDKTFPVVGVKLYFQPLWFKQFLLVTGTYGFGPSIPADLMLDVEMYEAVKQLVLISGIDTETGGRGNVTSAQIDRVSTKYEQSKKLTVRDLLADLTFRLDSIVNQYEATASRFNISIIG